MKRANLLIAMICGLCLVVNAQTLDWAKKMGGSMSDNGRSVIVDNDGNVYTCGYFSGTADFDPGPGTFTLTSAGQSDAYVSKLDSNGNFVWAKNMGGTGAEFCYSIAVDWSGNVYTTGFFSGSGDFDPGPNTTTLTSAGQQDIFLVSLNAAGDLRWAYRIGGSDFDNGWGVDVDVSGNLYVCGMFKGTTDFDPKAGTANLTSTGGYDIYVLKLDTGANFIWAKNMGTTGNDPCYQIHGDDLGNVYVTGYFSGSGDFDPGPSTFTLTSNGSTDAYFVKLKPNGDFAWAKNVGGTSGDYGWSLNTDPFGNVYGTGRFAGTADFDPGIGTYNLTSAGASDIFIMKLDSGGNMTWANAFSGTSGGEGIHLDVDQYGNVFSTGWFAGTFDFDPGNGTFNLTSAGANEIYLSKLDASGNFVWAGRLGGSGNDIGFGLDVDYNGNIYSTGYFSTTADFDPTTATYNLSSAGNNEAYVHKITFCNASLATISPTTCDTFLSPSGKYVWNSTGSYSDTLTNSSGCDSLITINLTVTALDTSVTLNGSTLTSLDTNQNWQWIYCDSVAITGATNQSYIATMSGNYAVVIGNGSCADTSGCWNVIITDRASVRDEALVLYPNPATGKITIESQHGFAIEEVQFVDFIGKAVGRMIRGNGKSKIEAQLDLPGGLYFARIRMENGSTKDIPVVKH